MHFIWRLSLSEVIKSKRGRVGVGPAPLRWCPYKCAIGAQECEEGRQGEDTGEGGHLLASERPRQLLPHSLEGTNLLTP